MQWSVIIPMGRPEKVIGTLESLANQTLLPEKWEVILVGLHAKRVRWVFPKLPLRIVELDRVENPAATRNRGVEVALGKWLLFVDDDIELQRDFFEKLLTIVENEGKEAAFAGRLPGMAKTFSSRLVDHANFWSQQIDERGTRGWFYSAVFSIPKRVFNEVGGFNEEFAIGEDVDFTHRVLVAGYELKYEPSLVAHHNHGRTSLVKVFLYFVENGKGARFFNHHAYATRCFNIKSAVSRAYADYRTNRALNGRNLIYSPGIFIAYLVLQFSIEYHYQRFLLENFRYRIMPTKRLSDRVLKNSFELRKQGKRVRGVISYSLAVGMSFFEPIRR